MEKQAHLEVLGPDKAVLRYDGAYRYSLTREELQNALTKMDATKLKIECHVYPGEYAGDKLASLRLSRPRVDGQVMALNCLGADFTFSQLRQLRDFLNKVEEL